MVMSDRPEPDRRDDGRARRGPASGVSVLTGSPPPGLRTVRDADAAEVQRLIGACWAEYPGCVLDVDGEEPWLRAPATAYSGDQVPGRYRGRMWVVEEAGRLVASVAVRETEPGRVELKSLYVAASARRRGLGAALTHLVEREARRRGRLVVELWSDTRFGDAHRLYERLGFQATGDTRDLHDLSRTTELYYMKDLLDVAE
jgi:GNAT superfamily N-acetyltransferase